MNKSYSNRLHLLKEMHESLITRRNEIILSGKVYMNDISIRC